MPKLRRNSLVRGAGWAHSRATAELRPPGAFSLNGAANLSGVNVTERGALSLAAAFACINVLSSDLSSFPLRVVRRTGSGMTEETGHPVDTLLRNSPDGETTSMRARQAWIGHALGWGNGYLRVHRDRYGVATALRRMPPESTAPRRRKADSGLYYVSERDEVAAQDVVHLAGLGYDGLTGYSPPRLLAQAFALGLATETFGASLFGNGLNNKGVLKHKSGLSDRAFGHLRQQVEDRFSGVHNANRFLILEEGMEWQSTSMNAEDAQFLATRAFQVVEICRIYRVPPHKAMDYSHAGSAYRALEEANADYKQSTLGPWAEQIEQCMMMRLLSDDEIRAGFRIEHDMDAMMRGNMAARSEYYAKLFGLSVVTPNQVAAEEGFASFGPAGDVRYVSRQYGPANAGAGGGVE